MTKLKDKLIASIKKTGGDTPASATTPAQTAASTKPKAKTKPAAKKAKKSSTTSNAFLHPQRVWPD